MGLFLCLVIIELSVVALLSLIDFFGLTLAIMVLLVTVTCQIITNKAREKKTKRVENAVKSASIDNNGEKT